jgi:glyoxylase I family protein
MRIEHIGLQVKDPAAMADWYIANLGFACRRSADSPVPVRFIADDSGRVMLEIYRNPMVALPDYAAADPLILHLAYVCDDVRGTLDRLVAAGATVLSAPQTAPNGDELAILRDPWGVPIQLARRAKPMVE